MPRQAHTPVSLPGPWATAGEALTMTAADVANKEQVAASGKEIVIAHNSGAAPHAVTITSKAHAPSGRTGDITTEAIAAGEIRVYGGPFPTNGWRQTDGQLYFEADSAEVKFGVIRLP